MLKNADLLGLDRKGIMSITMPCFGTTDRTYRIGQDKNVMVHRLVTLGTFEEKIDEMIKQKKELVNLAVFEGEKVITELTDEEIYNIFSLGNT